MLPAYRQGLALAPCADSFPPPSDRFPHGPWRPARQIPPLPNVQPPAANAGSGPLGADPLEPGAWLGRPAWWAAPSGVAVVPYFAASSGVAVRLRWAGPCGDPSRRAGESGTSDRPANLTYSYAASGGVFQSCWTALSEDPSRRAGESGTSGRPANLTYFRPAFWNPRRRACWIGTSDPTVHLTSVAAAEVAAVLTCWTGPSAGPSHQTHVAGPSAIPARLACGAKPSALAAQPCLAGPADAPDHPACGAASAVGPLLDSVGPSDALVRLARWAPRPLAAAVSRRYEGSRPFEDSLWRSHGDVG